MPDEIINSSKRLLEPNERVSEVLFVAEHRPWLTGLGMVVLGSVLVAITIALGG